MRKLMALAPLALAACADAPERVEVDRWQRSVDLLQDLSHPSLKGRRAGTPESAEARRLIHEAVGDIGLESREQPFAWGKYTFANVVAIVDGDPSDTGPILVLTAHYDHLGKIGDDIFPGADDNASGSAALVAVAESFVQKPPSHDVVFAWVDAEEFGLNGAYRLVASELVPADRPVLNFNIDMIAQNPDGTLVVAGGYHHPQPTEVVTSLTLPDGMRFEPGFDSPDDGFEDVTYRSDHAAFHQIGLPWVMLTVKPHDTYHLPGDTFESLPLRQYLANLDVVVAAGRALEADLPRLAAMREAEEAHSAATATD